MADEGFSLYALAIQESLRTINSTLQTIREEMFTKGDMETFKRDVCQPRGEEQKAIGERVEKQEKFKIQMSVFPVIIGVLFSIATLAIAFFGMQNLKIELKNTSAVETTKTIQAVTAIEKGNK